MFKAPVASRMAAVCCWLAALEIGFPAEAPQAKPTPENAPLANARTTLAAVKEAPVLVHRDGQLFQPASVTIQHVGPAVAASIQIEGCPALAVGLKPGANSAELLLPPVAAATKTIVRLVVGDQVLDERTIERQPVRKWEIHLLHQTHLDIGFTHTQQEVLQRQVGFLYQALDLVEQTRDYPEDAKFKWHAEGMWAIDEFLRTATEEKRAQFLDAVRRGSIHLDAFYVHMMTGLGTEEQLLQLMQPAKDFEKKYGVPVTTAIGSDVPGYTWGLVSAMSQQGVKFLNMAPNNNHRLGCIYLLGNQPFYWLDPSGEHRVLCWMVPNSYIHFWGGRDRDVGAAVLDFIDHYLVARDYPYDIAQIRYEIGGDNGHPDPNLASQVRQWNEKHASPKIILSTNSRLYSEFSARYGKQLPVLSGDLTPYWEDGAASTSADLAINRRAKETLDQGLRLGTMLAPDADLRGDADRAWYNAVMYDEHTWGAHCSISQPFSEFTISQEKYKQAFAWQARELARGVVERAVAAHTAQDATSIDIYNTASWDRAGPVLLSADQSEAGLRLVDAAGQPLPTQWLAMHELAVLAPTIPAFGAKRFELRAGDTEATGDVEVSGYALENSRLRIEIDPQTGAIRSLIDKSLDKEFVDRTQGFGVNDYLYTLGRVTGQGYNRISGDVKTSVEDPGPVIGTLRIESAAPGCRKLVRWVRIYAGLDRVDLINEIDKAQELRPEGVYFAFPFQVPGGQPRIDVPFGVVRPEKDQLSGANRNYYCVQRWVDVSNEEFGITWVTQDAPMLQFHPFRIIGRGRGCLPEISMMFDTTPDGVPEFWLRSIDPGTFFYSWVMTNHWETNYRAYQEGPHRFVYSLIPHRGGFDPVASQQRGRGICQPLLAVTADPAKPVVEPLLRMDGDGVVVTAIHPSRDSKALMVRLFNTADGARSVRLQWGRPTGATWISNPGEEPLEPSPPAIEMGKLAVVTLRVDRADTGK